MFESFHMILPERTLLYNEPMKKHTTFRVGGNASLFIEPETIEQVKKIIWHCLKKNYPYVVIGTGSNLLVSDHGYDGVVVKVGSHIKKCKIEGNEIYAEAGIRLADLANQAAQSGLTGLEFAEGIPGRLGGGLFMNAGAYGSELNDLVESVQVINLNNGEEENILNIKGKTFGYRSSFFQNYPCAILSAHLLLKTGNKEEIFSKMRELLQKRKNSQPLNYPSAGSTFKRPKEDGKYAGALIEQANLKGYSIGGAQVSKKHAGFIINYNQATATDIWQLIKHVQDKVYQSSGIHLEPEVKFIGKFSI